jgi:hypothetical protein
MVDIKLQEVFPREVPIDELRKLPVLKNMELLKQGSRLSVQPVSEVEFETIVGLGHQPVVEKPVSAATVKNAGAVKKEVKTKTKKSAAKNAKDKR